MVLLTEILQREARGGDRKRSIHRALVLAVDLEGGKLQNPTGSGKLEVLDRNGRRSYSALVGPDNPVGSVKARILTDGFDRMLEDRDARVFWPMMPVDQIGLPVSPGEHVYVVFEDDGMEHGLWMNRVAGHDSANSFTGTESYTAPSAAPSAMDSFEANGSQYPRDEAYAGQAPTPGAMGAFEEE
jgi:hypothetical protein